jgi:hypothetical protein
MAATAEDRTATIRKSAYMASGGLFGQGPTSGAAIDLSERRLRGVWLTAARVGSAVIVAFALTLFVASLPITFTQLHFVCTTICSSGQLTAAQAQSLSHLGISLGAFATFQTVFAILTSLMWFGIAGVIFWRRSDNLVTLLVAVQLVTQGASDGASALLGNQSPWERPAVVLNVLNIVLLYMFLAVFPSGRFVPRWMGWVLVPASLAECLLLLPSIPAVLAHVPFDVVDNAPFIVLVILIAAQIYRYRSVSTNIQRQQTKWVIAGIGASIVVQLGLLVPVAFVPSLSAPDALYPLLAGMVTSLALTLGPIAFMFAVLRYRLYDIDVIINRTLVYGSLTGILAAVYVGAIIGLQALARNVVRQDSPVAIVVATLAVAALSQPLRSRIQLSVDRRFYRRKYDAQKTLEAFSASLRQELDPETLGDRIMGIVQETMQPEHVSLWIRPTTRAMTSRFNEMDAQGQTASEEEEAPK